MINERMILKSVLEQYKVFAEDMTLARRAMK